uniref:Hemoglobin subunit beta-2 n=1 Tax=Triturus cristatus TaxID=8323 RepID=HBB2_TRICR|nr:RecName: Full=Hemoglobin subunit beta-2; AltName: Full=Beta-2-globin; AltName: Full=Hemoglobin beta-2 chain; AltName: Full=Hemoglobin beta-minor chain [Triturus cristatus]
VHLTAEDRKEIAAILGKVNVDSLGGQCLARLIVVNPWSRRYFHDFGDLSSCDAICRNPKVLAHGAKVMRSIVEATKHLDNLREYYADLSVTHSLKFYVDPENFKLFSGIVIVCLALTLQTDFSCHKQLAFEKLMKGVSHALGHGY